MLIEHKKVTPVIPLAERLEIVRNVRFVDRAHAAMTNGKMEIWQQLRFNILFKGNDWQGTEKGNRLERDFATLGVEVVYVPYTQATSSSERHVMGPAAHLGCRRAALSSRADETEGKLAI